MLARFKKVLKLAVMGTEYTEYMEDIQPMIDGTNYNALLVFTTLFAGLFVIISIASLSVTEIRRELPLYAVGIAACICLSIAARAVYRGRHNSRQLLVMLYLLLLCGYVISLFMSLHGNRSMPAVTFNVMLVTLPLLVCDFPWRIDLLLVGVTVCFLLASHSNKPPRVFFFDAVNGISFMVIAICANTSTQYHHFFDFNNRRIIKTQRDTDALTGTLTRQAFEVNMQKVLCNDGMTGVLMALDIDNLKRINDMLGLPNGDSFVARTGRRLRKYCRTTDFVGRIGGDKFAVFMPEFTEKELVRHKMQELMDGLKDYFAREMGYDRYSVSIGCTIISSYNAGLSYNDLFAQAEHALYIAKNSGKDKCCFYGE